VQIGNPPDLSSPGSAALVPKPRVNLTRLGARHHWRAPFGRTTCPNHLTHTTDVDPNKRRTAAPGLTLRIRPKSASPTDTFPAPESGIPANIASQAG